MSTPADTATQAMDALRERIANYQGSKHLGRHQVRRAHRTQISVHGILLDVEYFADGQVMAATEQDPAELPVCLVQSVEVRGVDITALVDTDEIASRIEESWVAL